jgi:multidrug efflux system membrane fusion protein
MARKSWLLGSLTLFCLAITAVLMMTDTADVSLQEDSYFVPKVSIVTVPIKTQAGVLQTLAEITPRWSATLKAHVGGEIIEVSSKALAGESVDKGNLLIQIEGTAYRANFANAEKELADAQLSLLQAKKRSEQAIRDWERSGLESQPSDLALNKPQLEIARKAVKASEENIKAANKQNAYTKVTAPFSGIVTQRFVSIGQTVSAGDNLVHVLDQSILDIAVSLSSRQWHNLAENWQQQTALVKNDAGQVIAEALIKRGGGFLDPSTRQYKIFLEVKINDSNRVLAGEFVHIDLPGKSTPNSLRIPESAFTRDGNVWYVDTDDRLRYFASEVLFFQDNELIVTAPIVAVASELRIITTPLASFIAGSEVLPVNVGIE